MPRSDTAQVVTSEPVKAALMQWRRTHTTERRGIPTMSEAIRTLVTAQLEAQRVGPAQVAHAPDDAGELAAR